MYIQENCKKVTTQHSRYAAACVIKEINYFKQYDAASMTSIRSQLTQRSVYSSALYTLENGGTERKPTCRWQVSSKRCQGRECWYILLLCRCGPRSLTSASLQNCPVFSVNLAVFSFRVSQKEIYLFKEVGVPTPCSNFQPGESETLMLGLLYISRDGARLSPSAFTTRARICWFLR
jgi:hypothetical protein